MFPIFADTEHKTMAKYMLQAAGETSISRCGKLFYSGEDQAVNTYVCIRHINDNETKEYNAYPADIPIAIMSEKIADAYQLLENLAELSEVYPFAQKAIEKVKELTKTAIQKADRQKEINLEKIKDLEAVANNLKSELEPLKEEKASHDKRIESLYEEQKVKENALSSYEIRQKYESEHYEYRTIKAKISELEQKRS